MGKKIKINDLVDEVNAVNRGYIIDDVVIADLDGQISSYHDIMLDMDLPAPMECQQCGVVYNWCDRHIDACLFCGGPIGPLCSC